MAWTHRERPDKMPGPMPDPDLRDPVQTGRPLAPVVFLAARAFSDMPYDPDMELWNLTADVPGHPRRSTVTRRTLEGLGYYVPPMPEGVAK